MTEVGDFISRVGFPVAVAVFLLWRLNGKIERMTDSLDMLRRAIQRLHGAVQQEEEE